MARCVFHTLHIVVRDFSDSMEEELKTCCREDQLWQGLKLVHDINPFRQGNGVYAAVFDEDKHGDLEKRMAELLRNALSSRQRILEIGYWPGTTLAEIRRLGLNHPKVKSTEIKFVQQTSIAA